LAEGFNHETVEVMRIDRLHVSELVRKPLACADEIIQYGTVDSLSLE
jgi:hypothetical protein